MPCMIYASCPDLPDKSRMMRFITCKKSDVYTIIDYRGTATGIDVCINDWYEDSTHWYHCEYDEPWCYPIFYPTLAVRYGKLLD